MTPQEQNIAIAEACGWKPKTYGPEWHQSETKLPSYTTDLNAMHEAEKTLIGPQAIFYERTIDSLVRGQATTQPGDRYPKAASVCAWHATAAQRAEAFLKTIGKWKE